MSKLWQHPYVNVFKHYDIGGWKRCSKEGDVSTIMDKQTKGTVYRIIGSIPAGNYIQFPCTSSQTLGLTGRYIYFMFKPIPTKYFVVHLDVATEDGLAVRVSFSNLFKEFKSTSTWLQFPFVSNPSPNSVEAVTSSKASVSTLVGTAPSSTRWTILMLDLQYILSIYLNRTYSYLKTIRLCANMFVKGVYTSDMVYQPGISPSEARKLGLAGVTPMPKEMALHVPKGGDWSELYDHIKFPPDGQLTRLGVMTSLRGRQDVAGAEKGGVGDIPSSAPQDVNAKSKRAVASRVALVERLSPQKQLSTRRRRVIPTSLPAVAVVNQKSDDQSDVHVYPPTKQRFQAAKENIPRCQTQEVHPTNAPVKIARPANFKSLKPDPILSLKRIIGFGGGTFKEALWTKSGSHIVYPCHAIIITMDVSTAQQEFFLGHTDKVSALAFDGSTSLLASAQAGTPSVVRLWKYHTRKCVAMFRAQVLNIFCLSLSYSGNILCAVGRDTHAKQLVVVWDASVAVRGGEVSILAKAHTDVDIKRMKIAEFDDSRMVSCGVDNIRFWRLRNGSARSCPVELRQYGPADFTDVAFGVADARDPAERKIYCSTTTGSIFQVDYQKIVLDRVYKLLPIGGIHSNTSMSINALVVNEAFCVTGSDDGYLRLWPLDFRSVFLEAEHEGPVSTVDVTLDGLYILAGTTTGNLGVLNASTRSYTTLMRSHTSTITSMDLDPMRRHMGTVSADGTIRIWDLDTQAQLYDFRAPGEEPCNIAFHPTNNSFACGFTDGTVRVFDIETTNLLAEHKQHRGVVTGLVFAPNGGYLYSAGALGALAMYNASTDDYHLVRMLLNMTARDEELGPSALAVSYEGKRLVFVGPSEFTVTVVDARSLDEILRVDITTIATDDRPVVDTARLVTFAPPELKQLLVVTSSNRLLKMDSSTGLLLSEVSNVHRNYTSCVMATIDGRHLVTAGDKMIKVWDYHMRLDVNFQVFIGHADRIRQISFTPDNFSLVSAGEAILIWDFLGSRKKLNRPSGRDPEETLLRPLPDPSVKVTPEKPYSPRLGPSSSRPRRAVPQPTQYDPIDLTMSPINHPPTNSLVEDEDGNVIGTAGREESVLAHRQAHVTNHVQHQYDHVGSPQRSSHVPRENHMHLSSPHVISPSRHARSLDLSTAPTQWQVHEYKSPSPQKFHTVSKIVPNASGAAQHPSGVIRDENTCHQPPMVTRHYQRRTRDSCLATRRYTAPPSQAGMQLKSVLGYNGAGRNNMVWKYDTGLFAYTSGSIVVIEDLHSGGQKHLIGHVEEVSTITCQNDGLVLASASGSSETSESSQIYIWDIQEETCTKVLSYHPHEVVCLAYSRDDRMLISVGDFRDCSVVVWNTQTYDVITSSYARLPVHDILWDPYTVNEFATVGEGGSVMFWLVDETIPNISLKVHEPAVPSELTTSIKPDKPTVHFTCLSYAGDSVMYAGNSEGVLSAWDTRQNSCFLHWQADKTEIVVLISHRGQLIAGSSGGNLRLWSVVGVAEMRLPGENNRLSSDSLTMEDEMVLDGAIISTSFDDVLETGIVGTASGTLWYINWSERTSIRLVSGHAEQITNIVFSGSDDKYFATCAKDGVLHLWTTDNLEHMQFQVVGQSCNCVAFCPIPPATPTKSLTNDGTTVATVHPKAPGDNSQSAIHPSHCAAGYSDGTVRMFDLGKVEMFMKMQPHACAVTVIGFSVDGHVVISGGSDGVLAISSPSTGLTVRLLNDHKGVPITDLHVSAVKDEQYRLTCPLMWLAASADSRVSVWSADWSKDFCELVDWLTFPSPAIAPDGKALRKSYPGEYSKLPPSLARFSPSDPDIIVFTGYSMQRVVHFYSLAQRKVVRTAALTHWALSLDISPKGHLIAIGTQERLIKLMDYNEGSFQDFTGHSDAVSEVRFSPSGHLLYTCSHGDVLIWNVVV